MRLELDAELLKLNQFQLNLIHNDTTICWNITAFDKSVFMADHDVFKHINQYWAFLPVYKQEKIFLIFNHIKNIFEEVYDTTQLICQLHPIIKSLYEEHNLDEINQWMDFHSDIIMPQNLNEEYIDSDENPGSREKTYLKHDYRALLAMTISLRIMIPVWGEFMYRTKKETDTLFKEFYAFQLLAKTNLINSVPMDKLKLHVISNIQKDKPIYSSIINGIGTEDFPIWLLSKVLVNRLCIGDISGVNQKTQLISFIWNFINQKINQTNSGSFAGMVKTKEFESGDALNDHNASRLEGYKIKTELPIGDIVILEHYMDDPFNVAKQLKPNINIELLQTFLNHAHALDNEQIQLPQVTIVQYILKPVISPRGLVHLSKKQMIDAIAIAQTLLWENGHKTLTCMISAIATNSNDEMMLSGIDSRVRIPKELMEDINVLFPFSKVSAQKKKRRNANAAVMVIDELAQLFSQRDWILTAPDECVAEVTGKSSNRRFSCPHDIKVLLAKLIIELVKSR